VTAGDAVGQLPEDDMAPLLEDLVPESGDWQLFDGAAQPPWRLVIRGHDNGADPEVILTDLRVQGDARRVTWNGDSEGSVALVARPPVDLSSFLDDNAVVAYDLRPEGPVPDHVEAGMRCGHDCGGERVDLAAALGPMPTGEWRTLRVDLACYAGRAADLAGVERIELLVTGGAASLSVANVRIERHARDRADLRCPR